MMKTMSSNRQNKLDRAANGITLATLAAITVVGATALVQAGTTGTELQGAWTAISGLLGGFGGKIIALTGLSGSLIAGYLRQSMPMAAVGGGLSLGVALAPNIVDTLVSATI